VRRTLGALATVTGACAITPVGFAPAATARTAAAPLPPIRHVFIIVEENESASTTFAANSPAPYLARTLRSEGAYLPHYYGIGHESNDNYIALISGQAPNPQNQADCQLFDDFQPDVIGSYGQAVGSGCVFPADVKTIADQLDAAGLTWRDYNESMGADASREAAECGHPGIGQRDNTQTATPTDQYATRHNPFVYFHSIIDNTTLCDTHVVNLDLLPRDLASAASTPNYVFITPDLCSDGHDATCADRNRPGGFAGIDAFLQRWVPRITGSPAFKDEDGLLAIVFDEAATSDTSACCGEIPGPNSPSPGAGGPGGGDTGAVLISPCIKPGTVSSRPYNHYALLRSVEDLFRLPHLGYAQLPGESSLGADVFTRRCPAVSAVRLRAPAVASNASAGPRFAVRWSASAPTTVQVRRTSGRPSAWRTLVRSSTRHFVAFAGRPGATYEFRARAGSGAWALATTVVPTGVHPIGGRYRGRWHVARVRDAWEGRAIVGHAGATFTLTYRGGPLALIADLWPQGGVAEVVLDGRLHTLTLRSRRPRARQVVYRATVPPGRHRLRIRVLRGVVPIEGYAITNRR
jgi:hypothetical protein